MVRLITLALGLTALFAFALWLDAPAPAAGPVTYEASPTTPATSTAPADDTTKVTPMAPRIHTLATGLEVPWEIVSLPSGELLVTERPGRIQLLEAGRTLPVPPAVEQGEGGLMGAALHPDFASNRSLYLYYTTAPAGRIENRIERYVLEPDGTLTPDRMILAGIPAARYHDGGRIAFGPDGYLYATVGDAGVPSEAQDPASLHGTILRMTPEGGVPDDNPFGSLVYSYGHRNAQGLAWDSTGQLWSTEHGRSGLRSGFDELNRIEAGGNYGWPESQGDVVAPGTIAPVRHSGADTTWAPASLAYHAGSLYFAGLRGETLYEAVLSAGAVSGWHEHLVGEYGRLRTVTTGPDGQLYVSTSNRDGRGNPVAEDDRILRIDPAQLTN